MTGGWIMGVCDSTRNLIFSRDTEYVPPHSFEDCLSLGTVQLNHSMRSIGAFAFAGCRNLSSVVIPNSITLIDDCAFYGCDTSAFSFEGDNKLYLGVMSLGRYTPQEYGMDAPVNRTSRDVVLKCGDQYRMIAAFFKYYEQYNLRQRLYYFEKFCFILYNYHCFTNYTKQIAAVAMDYVKMGVIKESDFPVWLNAVAEIGDAELSATFMNYKHLYRTKGKKKKK